MTQHHSPTNQPSNMRADLPEARARGQAAPAQGSADKTRHFADELDRPVARATVPSAAVGARARAALAPTRSATPPAFHAFLAQHDDTFDARSNTARPRAVPLSTPCSPRRARTPPHESCHEHLVKRDDTAPWPPICTTRQTSTQTGVGGHIHRGAGCDNKGGAERACRLCTQMRSARAMRTHPSPSPRCPLSAKGNSGASSQKGTRWLGTVAPWVLLFRRVKLGLPRHPCRGTHGCREASSPAFRHHEGTR